MLLGVGWLYVLLLMHQSGIARTSDVLEQSESIADILSGTHTAIFLVDMHGMVHTDEIGMHTVLYSLQDMSRRDARQPRPPWSSLTLRRRTSDERAASSASASESWRQSPQSNLRCRRRGVVRWTGRMYLRVTSTSPPACVKHRRAPRPVEARRLYRGLASQG